MFINLIRLSGLYWANMQGHLKSQPQMKQRSYAPQQPEAIENRDKLAAKKQQKHESGGNSNKMAVGMGVGAGVILAAGGLALVANPNVADYNDNHFMDEMVDGLHDGVSVLGDISFGDLIDVGEGALGAFEDIDWPDIDFEGFADAAGDLFGDVGEFFANAGEGVADVVGDLVNDIGGWFD
jgi:hypothetical protein